MQVSKKKADLIFHVIDQWKRDQTISEQQANQLKDTIFISPINWKFIAKVALYFSLLCILFALGSIVADQWLIDFVVRFFKSSNIGLCIIFSILSVLLYGYGFKRRTLKPDKTITNEFIMLIGAAFTAVAVTYFEKTIGSNSPNLSLILFFIVVIYGAIALSFNSKTLWILAIVTLGIWFGTETSNNSLVNHLFFDLNYPVRFVFFGAAILSICYFWFSIKPTHQFLYITFFCGLLYFFIALYFVSIFGNYHDINLWQTVKQIELIYWAGLSVISCLAAIIAGFKFHYTLLQKFGIIFLFLNLFSRYAEYFWDSIHKAIFFGLLGLFFWLIGYHAEKIWNLNFFNKSNNYKHSKNK